MSITTLQARLNRMIRQIDAQRAPKLWSFCLGLNETIPEETRALIQPYDEVVIRQYDIDVRLV